MQKPDFRKVLEHIELSDQLVAVVEQGYVPLPIEVVEFFYNTILMSLEIPHGYDETLMYIKGTNTLGRAGDGKPKRVVHRHIHKEARHLAPDTPHAVWHVLNDYLCAVWSIRNEDDADDAEEG